MSVGLSYTTVTPKPVRIVLKDEDLIEDEIVGPVTLIYDNDSTAPLGWLLAVDARDIARILKLTLELE